MEWVFADGDILKLLAAILWLLIIVGLPVAAWITHATWWSALVVRRRISRAHFFWGLAGILIPIFGMLHGWKLWVEWAQQRRLQ